MAVIRCPHCGELISSTLSSCTECGKKLDFDSLNSNDENDNLRYINEDVNKEENENIDEDKDVDVNENVGEIEGPEDEGHEVEVLQALEQETEGQEGGEDDMEAVQEGEEPEQTEPVAASTSLLMEMDQKATKWYHLSARRIVILCFLAPFVFGFFYLLYKDVQKARDLEDRAYARLENCTNLLFYEDFLVRFPESDHAAEVKSRYETMKKEHEMFFREAANGTREQLMAFIAQHPTSPYRRACEMRVDSLDWTDALESNSLDGYQKYLALHPAGLFLSDAQNARNQLQRLVVTPEETSILRGALDNFLSAMTSGDADRINQMTGQSFTFCGQSEATGENVVDYYRQHLHGEDVLGVHFSLGGVSINKRSVQGSDAMSYSLYSTASATINRSALDSVNVVQYRVTANFSPERRITSVSVSQVVPVETPASAESTVAGQ